MNLKWSNEEEHLLKLLRPTNSITEISLEFAKRFECNLPGFRCIRTPEAVRKKCDRDSITPENTEQYLNSNPFVDKFESIQEIQKQYEAQAIPRTRGLVNKVSRKILSVSDIHFPFARNDLLREILEIHSDADIVVVNGDMLEGYVYSTYEKQKRIAALDEYRCAFEFVKMLSQKFPKVFLVDGNHDIRVARTLKGMGFENERTQILRPNLIARIANGEELDHTGLLIKKHDFANVIYEPNESWYIKIGKTIFAHPHGRGSSHPGSTAKRVMEYFDKRYREDEFDSVVVGHTHKIYKGIINSKLLIEQGCLAGLMMYAHSPKLDFNTNGMNGYAVIHQDTDGNTDFNWSTPVFLGEVLPPKKDALA